MAEKEKDSVTSLFEEIFGPVSVVPDKVRDTINKMIEAGQDLEKRVESLEATTDNISSDEERGILYAMIDDNGKELLEINGRLHSIQTQLQVLADGNIKSTPRTGAGTQTPGAAS